MFTFNPAFEAPTGSPIRELFKYLAQPGMISFAGGYPASDLFDRDGLDAAASRASQHTTLCLQYGPTDGLPVLKEQLAHLTARRGVSCTPQDVLVTTGSQQGFDLLLRVMVAPGDVVLVEQPAYPATLQALKLQEADVIRTASISVRSPRCSTRARCAGRRSCCTRCPRSRIPLERPCRSNAARRC
ncbi:aminotransferase class I and II [Paraburkholderia sp. BL25I1N1]|nr:aminotransferase class I and II [Paraburkholderia sp. BL25I1N1]